jgi:hypothetical protein
MRFNAIYKLGAVVGVFCALVFGLTGCGGGGGGGGNTGGGGSTTVTGTVLSVTSGLPEPAGATVRIGGQTVTTDATGRFTLTGVNSGTTSGSVTAAGELPLPLTLALKANTANDLGTLYLSDVGYTATVTGRVVTTTTAGAQPVGGATVTIANATTISAANGTFTLTNLPVGLGATEGTYGKVTAPTYEDKVITAETLQFALVAGANPIGDVLIAQPTGSVPSAPYTIKGVVTAGGAPAAGVSVSLAAGGVSLGSTTTDNTGTYYFWVVPGTYLISGVTGSTSVSTTVALTRTDVPVTAPTIALP